MFNFSFLTMSQFDLPITQKKKKLWMLSKLKGSIWKYGIPCLGGQHLPKHMG
jgi:hypothetical protein